MDFDVVKTPNIEVTVEFLASITAELDQRYAISSQSLTQKISLIFVTNKTGKFTHSLTFLTEVVLIFRTRVKQGDFEALRLLRDTCPRAQGRRPNARGTLSGSSSTSTRIEPGPSSAGLDSRKRSRPTYPRSGSFFEIEDSPEGITSKNNGFPERSGHEQFSGTRTAPEDSGCKTGGESGHRVSRKRKTYSAIDIDDVLDSDRSGKRTLLSLSPSAGVSIADESDSEGENMLNISVFGEDSLAFTRRKPNSSTSRSGLSGNYSPESTNPLSERGKNKSNFRGSYQPAESGDRAVNSHRSGGLREAESDESKINDVRSLLPNVSFENVVLALSSSCGDVERAIAFILDGGMADSKTARTKELGFIASSCQTKHDTIDLTSYSQ